MLRAYGSQSWFFAFFNGLKSIVIKQYSEPLALQIKMIAF